MPKFERRTDVPDSARDAKGQIIYGHSTGVYIDNEKYPLDWAKCGTRANFKAHKRRGQQPCSKCRHAEVDRRCKRGCTCGKHFRKPEHNVRIGMSVKLTAEAKKGAA